MKKKTAKGAPADPGLDSLLLDALLDALPDAVYFKDLQSRFIRTNRVHTSWLGVKKEADAIGKSDADFYTPEFARAAMEVEQRIIKTGEPIINLEEKLVWPSGKSIWASATKMPLKDRKGRVIGTLGFSRDISAGKRQEERIRDSEALYHSLVESLPMCIFRKDLEGKVVYVNQRYCTELKMRSEDLLGKTDYDLFPKKLAEKYRRDDQIVMRHGRIFDTVEEHKPPGQAMFKVKVIKTPVFDSKGQVVGVQGMFWRMSEENPA
jgi:PAS domain S-box-containing protein